MSAAKNTQSSTSARGKASERFSKEERAAMRERAREQKAAAAGADGERALLDKIDEMQPGDRAIAGRLHEIIRTTAPELTPRTWYGMPAYAKDGKVLCYFQSGQKFKTRYATLGFSDRANLDDGAMWPTVYALTKLTTAEEKQIKALLERALG